MIITIASKKGGDGKSPIATLTAKATDSIILMNDEDITELVHEDTSVMPIEEIAKLDFSKLPNTVIDIGGHIETGILEVIKKSDLVIVPIVNEPSSLMRNINALREFLEVNKNIIVIATRTKKATDFENIKDELKDLGVKTLFELKETELFSNALTRGLSVDEVIKKIPNFSYLYGKRKGQKRESILEQWTKYINYVIKQSKGKK